MSITKYLQQWTEEEAQACGRWLHGQGFSGALQRRAVTGDAWPQFVVVPAFAEGEGLTRMLESVPRARSVVAVCVINGPAQMTDQQRAAQTRSWASLQAQFPASERVGAFALRPFGNGLLVTIDAVVAPKQGVGRARKIGVDTALVLWAQLAAPPTWLHMTDADVTLSQTYFDTPPINDAAALIHPWRHVAETPAIEPAMRCYETRLRHHALGLQWATSEYAFETIGSTIAVAPRAYAAVRGVPRRAAGEDFYLLNKLAKVGEVTRGGGEVTICARRSDRVPFGTGRAILAADDGSLPRCYEPLLFDWLKRALSTARGAVDNGATMDLAAPDLDPRYVRGLRRRDWPALIDTINASGATARQRRRRLRETLDAFATLKLLHAWRDEGLVDVSIEAALQRSPWAAALRADVKEA